MRWEKYEIKYDDEECGEIYVKIDGKKTEIIPNLLEGMCVVIKNVKQEEINHLEEFLKSGDDNLNKD